MSRTRNSAWTISSRMVFAAATTATGVFATPWLLRWLGQERMGAYRVLIDWFGYLNLLELGITGSVMACLAAAVGRRDAPATAGVLAAAGRVYIWLTLAMVVAGSGLVALLPRLVPVRTVSVHELQFGAVIMACYVLLTPLSVFRGLAEARQRGYVVNLLQIAQSFTLTASLLLAAWAGWGLAGQCFANVITQVPAALVLTWIGLRTYGRSVLKKPEAQYRRALWKLNWPTLVYNVTGKMSLVSDNLIIGWWMGPAAVVPFFLTQRLATLAQSQLEGIGSSTWAGLTELYAQGHHHTFRQRVLELTGVTSGLCVALLAPIAAFNHHFVAQWVGAPMYAGEFISVVACCNMWFWSLFSFWGWLLSGSGQIGRWVPYAVASAAVNLFISIAGTVKIGLPGPLLGTLAAFLLVNVWGMSRILWQAFEIRPRDLWSTAAEPLAWGIPYAAGIWFIMRSHTPAGWPGLVVEMALAGAAGLVLWWSFGLSKDARMVWLGRVRIALGT